MEYMEKYRKRMELNTYKTPERRKVSEQEKMALMQIGIIKDKIKFHEKRLEELEHEIDINLALRFSGVFPITYKSLDEFENEVNKLNTELKKLNNSLLVYENTVRVIRDYENIGD